MSSFRSAPAVVLVPGLGLDAGAWTRVLDDLPGRPRVVRLPSLGLRSRRGGDLRAERQAERLLDDLTRARAGAVVLVGHSASCPVVVEAAARSGSVVGLVLVGPVTDPRARTWPRMLAQWARTATHERPAEVPLLVPQYGRTGVMSMARGMDAVRRYDTARTLQRLDCPVVVVRGAQDRIAPAGWCRYLADAGSGRLVTVGGAAHMVPLTHPGAVVGAVRDVSAASTRPG